MAIAHVGVYLALFRAFTRITDRALYLALNVSLRRRVGVVIRLDLSNTIWESMTNGGFF